MAKDPMGCYIKEMKNCPVLLNASNKLTEFLDWCASFFSLLVRLYIAYVFVWSGWLKTTSWDSTLYLFEHEFKILLLPPVFAAYFGTVLEILLPILMLIGIGARLPALGLFLFNVFSVVSYPTLLTPEYACALKDHIFWGSLIAIIIFYGHGRFSLDHLIQRKYCGEYLY